MSSLPKNEIDVQRVVLTYITGTAANAYVYSRAIISHVQGRVSMDTIRPLPMFLGILSPGGFCFNVGVGAYSPPVRTVDKSTIEKFKSRLKLNTTFFMSNYAMIVVCVALIIAFLHPSMIFSLGVIWALWSLHSFLNHNEILLFSVNFSTLIPSDKRLKGLYVLTTIVILWKCLIYAINVTGISFVLIFSHALLRDPKHIEQFSQDYMASSTLSSSNNKYGTGDDDEEEYYPPGGGSSSVGLGGSEVLVDYPNTSTTTNRKKATDAV